MTDEERKEKNRGRGGTRKKQYDVYWGRSRNHDGFSFEKLDTVNPHNSHVARGDWFACVASSHVSGIRDGLRAGRSPPSNIRCFTAGQHRGTYVRVVRAKLHRASWCEVVQFAQSRAIANAHG
jgi:hypothetical protein